MDVHVDALLQPTEHNLQQLLDLSWHAVEIFKLQQPIGLEEHVPIAFLAVLLWGVGHQPAHWFTIPLSPPCVHNTRPRPYSAKSGRLHCALYAAEY